MNPVAFLPFSFPGLPGVGCAFTSRRGGASPSPYNGANLSFDLGDDAEAVRANREAVARRLGLSGWCECRQVHGTTMHNDPEPGDPAREAVLEGDGMFTARPGAGLVIKTADCQPLMLAHESGRYVGALHVGWRGNVAGLPGLGVARFCEAFGLDPAGVLAVRGPSLGPARAEFTGFEVEFGPGFQDYFDPDTRTVDLWRLTRDQLVAAGLRPENIFGMDLCTYDHADTFFSYRRDRMTGRQAGIIWIRP